MDNYQAQIRSLLASFARCPRTMLQASYETGVLRANICRYIAMLQKEGLIHLAFKGLCPITKHRAGFYTTNIDLVKK